MKKMMKKFSTGKMPKGFKGMPDFPLQ